MNREIINQTNRTMLFEEINPQKLDILTLIEDIDGSDSLSDEKILEINEHLLVSSFKEFLEKFDPKIYSYFNVNTQSINYTLEKPQNISEEHITEVPINLENSFFKMLYTLIENRQAQGLKNVEYNFADILDMISPKKIIEDIKQVRKEINYLHQKYQSYDEEDPRGLMYGDKLNAKFQLASSNYNNILAMLPLAIEDIKTRLSIGQKESPKSFEKLQIGALEMDNNGDLKVIEVANNNLISIENHNYDNTELIEAFKYDYEKLNDNHNEYVSNLIVRTFVPLSTQTTEIDYEKEIANYNNYLDFYKLSQEQFIATAKPLIEKILGIKLFFDQYHVKNPKMQVSLLITNISSDLLIRGENKKKLEIYLNTVNTKNDFDNTVWFAIIPSIEWEEKANKNIKEIFRGSGKKEEISGITMDTTASLLQTLYYYKVQSFISFKGNENNDFASLSSRGIKKYVEKTKSLENQVYSEYAISCLPNFTIIPKEQSGIVLDKKINNQDGYPEYSSDEELVKFFINGIYVDASYISAGLVASYQCPNYMKELYKNVLNDTPAVRFNIEVEDNTYIVKTSMPKEISGFTSNIKEEINSENYGFVFSSDSANIKGEKIRNITVYKARSLLKNDIGMYEPIYKTLTTTYIERVLRYQTMDFKEDKLNHFFSSSPNSQKSKWLKSVGSVNSIMNTGDDMVHYIDKENNRCRLMLTFSGDVKNLQVDINRTE